MPPTIIRKILAVVLAALLFGCLSLRCNAQSLVLSEMDYTRLFIDSLNKYYPDMTFTIESELTIKSDFKGHEFRQYLANSYKDYQLDNDSLSPIISRYVAAAAELFKEKLSMHIDNFIPLIKPVDYIDELKLIDLYEHTRSLRGIVINEYLEVMPFVDIRTLDNNFLGRTDLNGEFVITIPNEIKKLKFSLVGSEITIIELTDNCDNLDIIVMDYIFYHTQSRKMNRFIKKKYNNLPKLHQLAYKNGLFESETPCYIREITSY